MKLLQKILRTFIIVGFVICNINAYAQVVYAEITQETFKKEKEGFAEAWKAVKNGNKFFDTGNRALYSNALDEYLQAYKYNNENAALNYRIGVCMLNTQNKSAALKYLEKAETINKNVSPLLPYYLAKAQMLNLQFNSALGNFEKFQASKTIEAKTAAQEINRLKENCKNGKELTGNPIDVIIKPISEINSEYPDYCPVITADGITMYFTSRREDASSGVIDKADGFNYEDIYASKNNGNWQSPKNIGSPINTKDHDATVALSPDGNNLITYRNGDLYICERKKGKWSAPTRIEGGINTDAIENSACFSYDGNTIFFIRGKQSDPKKSNGDIYMSRKTKNGWSQATKLPPNINTKYDEDGVFMLPDGKTLFFSSKGHNSMGGYDIFKTEWQSDGSWSNPVNLGYPVNTPDDEIYFVLSADGKTGYYSAAKPDGKGYTDIYEITFLPPQKKEEQPSNQTDTVKTEPEKPVVVSNMTLLTGKITACASQQPLNATIEIYDNSTNSMIYTTEANTDDGGYIVSLPAGKNYNIAVKMENYMYHSENIQTPNNSGFEHKTINICLNKIETGSKITLNNLFFDTDKYEIKPESEIELAAVHKLLTDNPTIKLEISGHTDNTGSKEHNITLSKNRAEAVKKYLINKGINENRLSFVGFGDSQPTDTNETVEGRAKNRRVEIKIVK